MKKLLIGLSLIALVLLIIYPKVSLANIHSFFYYSPCNTPITFRVDTIDPRFNLSREKFTENVEKAAQIWNGSYSKPLFQADPKGVLSINLIYDERQSLNTKINELEDSLVKNKTNLQSKIAQYDQESAEFKRRLADLNNRVDYWNQNGGAPPEEYDKLTKEQQELQKEADRLNNQAKSLNLSADNYNTGVGKLNQTVNTYNEALQYRPEEGIYDPNQQKIEVYFNINQKELIHTLAHEMGHALGIDHNNNQKSIMYHLATSDVDLSAEDLASLKEVCQEKNIVEVMANLAYAYYQYYSQNFSLNNSFN